jgi:hypothetical protein
MQPAPLADGAPARPQLWTGLRVKVVTLRLCKSVVLQSVVLQSVVLQSSLLPTAIPLLSFPQGTVIDMTFPVRNALPVLDKSTPES